ncbi:hypothetical protein ABH920_003031 [Catenulispora sp. EB89]|uniref:hypothetical protein n=1 Tax=Catenulispora sp. EB89 TaxID=3156257 RepID=UPI00351314FE
MASRQFIDRYRQLQLDVGRSRFRSHTADIEAWQGFVRSCESGYDNTVYDYLDELRVRDFIELALCDRGLINEDGYAEFAQTIDDIDERFRALVSEVLPPSRVDRLGWWWRRVPGFGGIDFVDTLFREFGVVARNIE